MAAATALRIINDYSVGHVGEVIYMNESSYYVIWYDSDKSDGIIKISEGFYNSNNNKHGLHIYYYSKGNKKCETYYDNGQKHGKEISYLQNGNLNYIINYNHGMQHGETIIMDINLNTKLKHLNFKFNELDGLQTIYYRGLKVQTFEYVDGKKNGIESQFDLTGKLMIRLQWKDGKKSGIYNEYHSNGKLKYIGEFDNDLLNGTIIEFDTNANQIGKAIYLNGIKVFY